MTQLEQNIRELQKPNPKLLLLGLLVDAIQAIISKDTTTACLLIAKVSRIISEEM